VIASGAVDARATEKLRAEMARARGETKLFDRGFENLRELKARAKKETGFEPPVDPVFFGARVAAE